MEVTSRRRFPTARSLHRLKMKRIFLPVAAVLLAVALLSYLLLPAGKGAPGPFPGSKGHSVREVARELQPRDSSAPAGLFFSVRKIFRHKSIRPGVYEVPSGASGPALYRQFLKGPPKVRVTFPEGWTARQMASQLEARGVCPAADFLSAVEKENARDTFSRTRTFLSKVSPPPPSSIVWWSASAKKSRRILRNRPGR